MNFAVRSIQMKHRGGTKQYNLLLVTRDDSVSICVKRWGKVGAWGQLDVIKGPISRCQKEFDDKLKEKNSSTSGYEIEKDEDKHALSKDEMLAAIGPYRFKLEQSLISYITGDPVPTSAVPDDDPEEDISPTKAAPTGATANSHPDWGTW